MLSTTRMNTLTLLLTVPLVAGLARADGDGQEDLDRATAAKINARTEADMTAVIGLAERALNKGLDEENEKFARNLLDASSPGY